MGKTKEEVAVVPVEEGEHAYLSQAALEQGDAEEVFPKCEGNNNGVWACVSHHLTFQNQLQKDFHISYARPGADVHRLAWICLPCGRVEVP